MALHEGLTLATSRDLFIDFVECDALNVVRDVHTHRFDTFFGTIIADIVEIGSSVGRGTCYYVPYA